MDEALQVRMRGGKSAGVNLGLTACRGEIVVILDIDTTLDRGAIEVVRRRAPQGDEELALLSDAVVLACAHRGASLELAMSEDALTGFLAWLEAAPPGQRVNVA